jgi:hypothetical protein
VAARKEKPRRRPAATPEARESQMVSLAINLAERQMVEGTASAQVITHFLKLGTEREKLERERLRQEIILGQAKADQIASAERVEKLYSQALKAMRQYQGQEFDDEEDYDDYD